ncbi:MAG: SGNH/GDSL hydrolase family protein [Clostridia bacterium]|nr:SGNH/GDSL hydrolase family protein [Clostridia bacterium]
MNEIEKNTVEAVRQLEGEGSVFFLRGGEDPGLKVLFVGNSITLHGPKADLGWNGWHGMAASSPEKDYVHLCIREMTKKHPDVSFAIAQVCEWEVNYKNGAERLPIYAEMREFGADVIIMRTVENCPVKDFDAERFLVAYKELIAYLDPDKMAKIVLTTSFWPHPADETIRAFAKASGYALCELGDLGRDPAMKAIGLFEHRGVAEHPGDAGMRAIADRILAALEKTE